MNKHLSFRSISLFGLAAIAAAGLSVTALSLTASAQKVEGTGTISPAARCAAIKKSVVDSGFSNKVTVSCDDPKYARIGGDTYPDHPLMNGITGTNDQVPIPAPGYTSPVTLSPSRNDKPISIDAALGIAVNGVPIYDYTSQGTNALDQYYEKGDTFKTGELDICGGHSGRGDDYHYHVAPNCMIAMMKNKSDPAAIIGWAFDGYPIYRDTNPDGSAIAKGKLDVCNGQPDSLYGMRYHTSSTPPYIIQCLDGNFDMSLAAHVTGTTVQGTGARKVTGRKPTGGVQNLKLVEDKDGARTMTYEWQGKTYFFKYKPASQANCWEFSEQSFTTNGAVVNNTYCRTGSFQGGPPGAGMGGGDTGGMGGGGMGGGDDGMAAGGMGGAAQ